jgi:hypothetical protein
MNVGPCASTGTSPRADALSHPRRAQRRRERQVAPGERLADAHDVRAHPRVLGGEQRPRAPEAGGDLVEDQQNVVLVTQCAQHPQIAGGVEAHSPRALDDRLDDHGGELAA